LRLGEIHPAYAYSKIKKNTMSETILLIQIVLSSLLILGYSAYLYYIRTKLATKKLEKKNIPLSNIYGNISVNLKKKHHEKLEQRAIQTTKRINHTAEEMHYSIPLAPDIQLLETDSCLLIKGTVQSIAAICDEFATMEQLPQGYCVQLGDWKFFVMEVISQSSREDKLIVMPRSHWLFMSSKLKGSIYGKDLHPYIYVYEPFTFKKVLDYGIGVEATDYAELNKEEV
jgi:hypothetical protein